MISIIKKCQVAQKLLTHDSQCTQASESITQITWISIPNFLSESNGLPLLENQKSLYILQCKPEFTHSKYDDEINVSNWNKKQPQKDIRVESFFIYHATMYVLWWDHLFFRAENL